MYEKSNNENLENLVKWVKNYLFNWIFLIYYYLLNIKNINICKYLYFNK